MDRFKPLIQRPVFQPEVVGSLGRRDPQTAFVEALLFAADQPLSLRKLAKAAGLADIAEARDAVERLNKLYLTVRSSFAIEQLADGFQMLTTAGLRPWIDRLWPIGDEFQLSEPTLDTLAIVAYRQPICRADIEAIRGVQVGESLRQLIEKDLVRTTGREETLGRPFLYGTTTKFLHTIGLRSLAELPLAEVLGRKPSATKVEAGPLAVEEDSTAEA